MGCGSSAQETVSPTSVVPHSTREPLVDTSVSRSNGPTSVGTSLPRRQNASSRSNPTVSARQASDPSETRPSTLIRITEVPPPVAETALVSYETKEIVASPLLSGPAAFTTLGSSYFYEGKCHVCNTVVTIPKARFCCMCGASLRIVFVSETSEDEKEKESSGSGETDSVDNRDRSRLRVRVQRRFVLGRGASGVVFGCVDMATGRLLACKELPIHMDDEQRLDRVREEIGKLHHLRHRHVVEYLGAYVKMVGTTAVARLVMDRHIGSTLLHALAGHPDGMPESVVQQYIYQLLCAVDYIHSMSITHRDIKPGNVLLTNEGIVKLTDFCTATVDHIAGTPGYMPPEALTGLSDKANALERAKAHDIWSLGCTAYHLLTGRVPWSHRPHHDTTLLLHLHHHQRFEFHVPVAGGPVREFIEKCVQSQWTSRPSAKALLDHFSTVDDGIFATGTTRD